MISVSASPKTWPAEREFLGAGRTKNSTCLCFAWNDHTQMGLGSHRFMYVLIWVP